MREVIYGLSYFFQARLLLLIWKKCLYLITNLICKYINKILRIGLSYYFGLTVSFCNICKEYHLFSVWCKSLVLRDNPVNITSINWVAENDYYVIRRCFFQEILWLSKDAKVYNAVSSSNNVKAMIGEGGM
ncbi:MAG: hypothetical protein HON23_02075 [Rickettsiales bacterium]|jgi:hypothetical protein|nr:hypothetical protein [Rickettsiales bacterium]